LLPNKAYKKGYSLERYCQLTLEFNGYHVKRNTMSIGIEDVLAFNDNQTLLIQCKNTKRGEKSMTKDEIEILKRHAQEFHAVPVYLYKDGRGIYVWHELILGLKCGMKPYTKEWYRERMKMREMLRKMKKKNLNEYNKYVLKNWPKVKEYIC
jgi:Holliday junction resolvase